MAQQGSGDGLLRWLLGGLAAGTVVLGLLIAAYAVGYHRGQHHPRQATAPATPITTQPATTPTTPTPSPAPPASPAQLLATGKRLFTADGCSACHSLTGAAGAGPTLKGLAGSDVALTTGQSVKADGAYLAKSITNADAQIVKGYDAGIMPVAVNGFDLAAKPADVKALIAFITAQR